MRHGRTVLGLAALLALTGCDSDETPTSAGGGPTPLAGEYLLRVELSSACTTGPVHSVEWSGEAFRGENGTVFRVPSLSAPNDPTEDHIRVVLWSEGGGNGASGQLKLNGALVFVEDPAVGFASATTIGLAGLTGTIAGGAGGRAEMRDARMVGTVAFQWEHFGSVHRTSCAGADHHVSLLPL